MMAGSAGTVGLFLTYWFFLFIAVVYPLYWFLRWPAVRLVILLVACAVFHTHFAGPAGVLPIIVLALVTYLAGLSRNRAACYAAVALCAAALVFYKYARFLCLEVIGGLAPQWKTLCAGEHHSFLAVAPPLAISFFVFEFIHYLVDVSRGGNPIRNPVNFALYAIFWPSIVA